MGLMGPLVSVGYEGRDVDGLIQTLKGQDVRILVDVRLTPISRKKGLSKTSLRTALQEAGISYVHHRELGNPKDNRDAFRDGTSASRARFQTLLERPAAVEALHHVTELMDEGVVALLCFERDHSQCHRGLVANALVEGLNVELVNV